MKCEHNFLPLRKIYNEGIRSPKGIETTEAYAEVLYCTKCLTCVSVTYSTVAPCIIFKELNTERDI